MRIKKVSTGHLPQNAFLILSCLENNPAYVIALKQHIEQHSGDNLEPGTLYGALARLEQRGWIIALHGRDSLYQLTEGGKEVLENYRIAIHERQERIGVLARNTFFKASTTKERTMKLLTWIIKLYPRAWRVRYETEMLAVLEAHTVTLWTIFDLFFSAIDARLDPYYRSEKTLFSFKSVYAASVAFVVMFAIALFCMLAWFIQTTQLWSPLWYGTGLDPYSVVFISYKQFLYMVLFTSNVLIAIIAAKRAIVARHIRAGTVLLAVVCFIVVPFILLHPYVEQLIIFPFERLSNGSTEFLWISFYVFVGLELLMECVFLTISRSIAAVTVYKKKIVFFIIILILELFLVYCSYKYSIVLLEILPILLPFAGIGALLLVITNINMNRRNLGIALVLASLLVLGMVIDLLGSIGWIIFSWSHMVQMMGPWFFFNIRYPLIATIVLAVTMIFALAALKYGFSALKASHNTSVASVKNALIDKAEQALPPQMQ